MSKRAPHPRADRQPANDGRLDREVALKELGAFHTSDPTLAWRFLRERNDVAVERARVALVLALTFSGLALLILGLSRFTSLQI